MSEGTKEVSKEFRKDTIIKSLDESVAALAKDVTSLSAKLNTIQNVLTSLRAETTEHLEAHDIRLEEIDEVLKTQDDLIRHMATTHERIVNAVSIVILTTERTEKKVSGIDVDLKEIKDLIRSCVK